MVAACLLACLLWQQPPRAEIVEVRKIWDKAPHCAFTDLVRHDGKWFCVFREGKGHVSPDGALRVLMSEDGKDWQSAALVRSETADLRDPKLSITPDGKLMLIGAAALHSKKPISHQTMAWFSQDGKAWSNAHEIGEPNYWLWRVTWHGKQAFGLGYACGEPREVKLYKSEDGRKFDVLIKQLVADGYPNESSLVFQPDGVCLCLLRRDGKASSALLGTSKAPYAEWKWRDLGVRVGGPSMLRLPDGRLVAVVRLHDGKVRTGVCLVDAEAGKLTEVATLPSGGDCSYAGLVWHEGLLWVSYYSSHEGKASIYLAKVKLGKA